MMKRVWTVFVILVLAGTAVAQEQPAEMSAEEKAMMEAFARAATPGAQHAHLARLAGKWNVETKFWMEPGDPMKSDGMATRSMMLDGRVLTETFEGTFMGMPFTGQSMTGYDNVTGKWWSTWNDSMSTGLMTMEGQCTDSGDVCTWMGSNVDAMTGKTVYSKMVERFPDEDHHVLESWMIGPDGKEFKNMELVYTRKK